MNLLERLKPKPHEHTWGPEYHTHLGHATFGAHARHQDCTGCLAILTDSFSTGERRVMEEGQMYKPFWTILPDEHECFSGWRGKLVYRGQFADGESGRATSPEPAPKRPQLEVQELKDGRFLILVGRTEAHSIRAALHHYFRDYLKMSDADYSTSREVHHILADALFGADSWQAEIYKRPLSGEGTE